MLCEKTRDIHVNYKKKIFKNIKLQYNTISHHLSNTLLQIISSLSNKSSFKRAYIFNNNNIINLNLLKIKNNLILLI